MSIQSLIQGFENYPNNHRTSIVYKSNSPYKDVQTYSLDVVNNLNVDSNSYQPARYISVFNNNDSNYNKVFGYYAKDSVGNENQFYIKFYYPNIDSLLFESKNILS